MVNSIECDRHIKERQGKNLSIAKSNEEIVDNFQLSNCTCIDSSVSRLVWIKQVIRVEVIKQLRGLFSPEIFDQKGRLKTGL